MGLVCITTALFAIAVIKLFTKQVATIAGVGFTLALYSLFIFSERSGRRRAAAAAAGEHALDQFQLLPADDVGLGAVAARPGSVLVPVRDYTRCAIFDGR